MQRSSELSFLSFISEYPLAFGGKVDEGWEYMLPEKVYIDEVNVGKLYPPFPIKLSDWVWDCLEGIKGSIGFELKVENGGFAEIGFWIEFCSYIERFGPGYL